MDKAIIKRFSQFARSRLIPDMKALIQGWQKSEKVQGGVRIANTIYDDTELLNYTKSVDSLLKKVSKEGIDNVAEQAAYIWFNRIVALRYMEIHRYLPTRSSIFSASDGSGMPDIINNIHTEYDRIGLDANIVRKLQNEHNTEGLYELIFVGLCNKLSENYGFLFTKIDDWTQILFPRNILQTGHIIRDKNNGMLNIIDEDWNEVEIIGWIYQYYISERKDELITASKKDNQKFGKKEIGAVTQLFTPNWIVKYMVHNTVGKTWIENFPKPELKKKWEYFIDANYGDHIELNSPLDLTALDPACGSGHILVEAFNVLFDIYLSCGYLEEQIPELIIKHNLYGFEIDERAHQLACFAVLMKAKKYDKDIEKKVNIGDHIICIEENNNFMDIDEKKYPQFRAFMKLWYNAKIYGSLIKFDDIELDIDKVKEEYEAFDKENGLFSLRREELKKLIHQYELMSDQYVCVIANPPYMGAGNMDDTLKNFITLEYSNYKSDLFSAFICRNTKYTLYSGYLGFMTPFTWMFIQSYEETRKLLINNYNISSLVQLEYSGFDGATVPICTFTIKKSKETEGTYIDLSSFKGSENQAPKTLYAIQNPGCEFRYQKNQLNFINVPGSPIIYGASDNMLKIFKEGKSMDPNFGIPRQGMSTCDVNRFVKYRYEININDSNIFSENKKRVKYNKGGEYKKRYGNRNYVVLWNNNGDLLKDNGAALRNQESYFKEFIARTKLSSSLTSFRDFGENFLFDGAGGSLFIKNISDKYYFLGFLNSKINQQILKYISPTLNYNEAHIGSLPIIENNEKKDDVIKIVENCILRTKEDRDSFETSWDFKQHPFIKYKSFKKIQSSYANWINECSERFQKVKDNEEELNRIFNKIYGLEGEIDPTVEDEDVSIEIAFRDRDIRSLLSYMVGCMLGRYSLDQEGLIYAGGEFDTSKYTSFPADDDGIIPVLQDDYFNDDVVERAKEFVRKVWGDENYTENWNYLAECLDENSNNSDQTIRTYFNKEFMDNHFQVYQKRPIYWLFASNSKKWKDSAFKVIVYMHRYDKDTITNIRHKYLHGFQAKLKEEYDRLSKSNEKKDVKRCAEIQKMQIELADYDNKLKDFAEKNPGGIDLDDGVKVNYKKFMDAEIVAKLDIK